MANEAILQEISIPAGADLSANQFFAVKIDSSGNAVLAGAGEQAYILQNKPDSTGKEVTANLAIGGQSKALFGGTVAAGDFVASDAAGKVITAVANTGLGNVDTTGSDATEAVKGSHIIGQAVAGGAADEIGTILILNLGVIPEVVQ